MKLALIDIGSNTIRLLICSVGSDLKIKRIKHRRIVTRLAKDIVKTKRLNPKGKQSTIKGLLSFMQTCKSSNVNLIYAIATNAIRESIDGKEFITEIKSITGIDVEIISGEREAELTYEGVREFLDENNPVAIIDIGGGSTEFIFINQTNIIKKSIPIGVVKLKDIFLKTAPPNNETITEIQQHIMKYINESKILAYKPQRLFITGGTATTLACIDKQLKRYNPRLVHLHILEIENLNVLISRVSKMNHHEISKIVGVDSKRADVILPGMLIIKSFLLALGLSNFIISDYGLLEGLGISKAKALYNKITQAF